MVCPTPMITGVRGSNLLRVVLRERAMGSVLQRAGHSFGRINVVPDHVVNHLTSRSHLVHQSPSPRACRGGEKWSPISPTAAATAGAPDRPRRPPRRGSRPNEAAETACPC